MTNMTFAHGMRVALLATVAGFASVPHMALAQEAAAAEAPAPTKDEAPQTGEQASTPASDIVVTGTRLGRNGYAAPTPVTVVDAQRAERLAITNSSDLLNQIPAFRPSVNSSTTRSGSIPGASNADLRGLGPIRTLVLVDGRRFVPSNSVGTVDLNFIPSSLVSRTEVVTGGASAAYGADAVAGVVNFILNTKMTGFKGDISQGISSRGDNSRFNVSLAGGTSLFGGRGHLVVAGEYENNKGMGDCYVRTWCNAEQLSASNPFYGTNGLPGTLVVPNIRNARASTGGLIVTSPAGTSAAANALRGIAFGPTGAPTNYTFGLFAASPSGVPTTSPFMVGGGEPGHLYLYNGLPITVPVERYNAFGHFEYEFSDSITAFVEGSYGRVKSRDGLKFVNQGNITIRRDNAYLPASVAATMAAGGIASFSMGRLNEDLLGSVRSDTETYRAVAGLKGELGGGIWNWDIYYQYGRSRNRLDYIGNIVTSRFALATDAVANPANPSQIICRSTITAPTNGCVPINLFGTNQFTAAARDYVTDDGYLDSLFTQHVVAANISGSPFKTWAGDVTVAAGGEARWNRTTIETDPLSRADSFVQFNSRNSAGKIEVIEGYLEAGVPLAKDIAFIHSLDLNGAIRTTRTKATSATSESVFNATTWKAGLTYEPIEGVRFRVTRSRDIRAPNASELFSPGITSVSTVTDRPSNTLVTTTIVVGGNINARPERANTLTAGVVLQPHGFLRGVQFSVDYYNIKLDQALGQVSAQAIVDGCAAGATAYCGYINRTGGSISSINSSFINFGSIRAKGLDFDLSYNLPLEKLFSGSQANLALRTIASHPISLVTTDAATSTQGAGVNGAVTGQLTAPKWIVDTTATYSNGPFSFTLQGHYISAGKSRTRVVTPDDPAYSLTNNVFTTNNNSVPSRFYLNLVLEQNVPFANGDKEATLYLAVSNVFDKDPPLTSTSRLVTNPQYYDIAGRQFKVGARVKM